MIISDIGHHMKKIILLSLSIANYCWALAITPPENLSPQKGSVWASKAAINAEGAALVVWIKTEAENTYTVSTAARSNSQDSWTPAQTVSEPIKLETYFPSVASNGTCTIIWSGINQQKRSYYCCKKEGSNPWITNQITHYPELSVIRDVLVNTTGTPLILASYPGESTIYSFTYNPTVKPIDDFRNLPTLPTSAVKVCAPNMIQNQTGNIAALWGYFFDGYGAPTNYYFNLSKHQEAGKWNSATDKGSLEFKNYKKDTVSEISACLNKNDKPAIIWNHFEDDSSKIKLRSLVDKKNEVIRESKVQFRDSAILMDDEGNTVAVWIELFNKQNVVHAAYRPHSSPSWQGVPEPLSNLSSNAQHVELSYCKGVFVAVWSEENNEKTKRVIFGSTFKFQPEFKWTTPVQLSPTGQNCWYPSIALNEKEGIITWTTQVKRSPDCLIQVANLTVP